MLHKKHYCVADVVRAIAVILILNSHYEGVYPIELAIGGEMGLAIFFTLSGFLSSSIDSETKFFPWYKKKIFRLYISLYIWTIILVAINWYSIHSVSDFISMFIYPTKAWFSSWLVILYAVYFIFIKFLYQKWRKKALVFFLVLLLCAFIILYCMIEAFSSTMFTYNIPSKVLWLFCMLIGFYIHENYPISSNQTRRYLICGIIASVIAYGLFKIVLYKGYITYLKCMPTVLSVVTAVLLLRLSLQLEETDTDKVKSISDNKIIQLLSSSSLEIYYVQGVFIATFRDVVFPINWICITLLVLLCGYILHFIASRCIKLIKI